jgi:hypothetical protein
VLLKEEDRQQMVQVKDDILSWMKDFKPSSLISTDIWEI